MKENSAKENSVEEKPVREKLMKGKLQRFTVLALVLGLVTSLATTQAFLPAFAQDEVTGVLIDMGEGDNRVLSSNWLTLPPGEQDTYTFAYDGDEQPITVWMNVIPADAAQFQIWTDERLEEAAEDPETEPLGQGTAMTEDSGFTNWQGGSPEAETYYVVVSSTGTAPARYLLNISSPALAAEQPGATTDTTGVQPAAPAATPTADPNIAVVTTNALNVREGPSTAYPVIVTVPNGTQMTVLGRNATNTWIAVQLEDGTEGWVTRSLTNYTNTDAEVLTVEPLPLPTAEPAMTATATVTATTEITPAADTTTGAITDTTTGLVGLMEPFTDTETLEGEWQVLSEGETVWYTFQYRGGELPATIWMDLEPVDGATFSIVDETTARSVMAGTAPSPLDDVVGRGTANPIEPGYLFWQASFEEADTYYVMVENTGTDDTLYSIHALGPGVGRTIEAAE